MKSLATTFSKQDVTPFQILVSLRRRIAGTESGEPRTWRSCRDKKPPAGTLHRYVPVHAVVGVHGRDRRGDAACLC